MLLLLWGIFAMVLDGQSMAVGDNSLKIGIIGAGKIGGTLGELWAKAGHRVYLSSRHPDRSRT